LDDTLFAAVRAGDPAAVDEPIDAGASVHARAGGYMGCKLRGAV
jgi:hypothetical protein